MLDRRDRSTATRHRVSTTIPELAQWVGPGDEIFLADGAIVLRVERVDGDDVAARGRARRRAAVAARACTCRAPRPTSIRSPSADAAALDMAIAHQGRLRRAVVRAPARRRAKRCAPGCPKRGHRPQLVAKIETAVALDHLPGIVGAADAVMVARGDLGIQVPARRVPLIQKEIIRFCNMSGKPVITATQMLESMTESPLPTRAEVNDVANAVLDGTDALDAVGGDRGRRATPPTPCAR